MPVSSGNWQITTIPSQLCRRLLCMVAIAAEPRILLLCWFLAVPLESGRLTDWTTGFQFLRLLIMPLLLLPGWFFTCGRNGNSHPIAAMTIMTERMLGHGRLASGTAFDKAADSTD